MRPCFVFGIVAFLVVFGARVPAEGQDAPSRLCAAAGGELVDIDESLSACVTPDHALVIASDRAYLDARVAASNLAGANKRVPAVALLCRQEDAFCIAHRIALHREVRYRRIRFTLWECKDTPTALSECTRYDYLAASH